MSSIITALADITTVMLQTVFTVAGVILTWFLVSYTISMLVGFAFAWLKQKRRQKPLRLHRGPTIDI
jgi:hypothetical protein